MPTTKSSLLSEHGRLVDQKFLGTLSDAGAARLAHIRQEIDRLEAPKTKRLERSMARNLKALKEKISALEVKIANSASDSTRAKSAHP